MKEQLKYKVLHFGSLSMNPSAGPTYSVPQLVESQNTSNFSVDLINTYSVKSQSNNMDYISNYSKKQLHAIIQKYDLIVFHSNYIISHVKLSKIARKYNVPYIIVPRGGFTKKSKQIKKLKKIIADKIIFNKFFKNAIAYHFLTEKERENSVYSLKDDFVLPNGIRTPLNPINKQQLLKNQTIIFIGRIDIYHKGLDVLIESINLIKNQLLTEGIKIKLYGPNERDGYQYITKNIKKNGLEHILSLNTSVYGKEKENLLKESFCFIQTSRFEGMPMGVLEALSYGIPCILTPGTNLAEEVSLYGAGYKTEFDKHAIANTILRIITDKNNGLLSPESAIKCSHKFSWHNIGLESLKIYKTIINQT